nr:hypothetical protein B0A51_03190 [Rachicladosporium sp. CCFEE 5018]
MSHAVLRSSSSSSIGSGSELSSRLDERLARYYDRAGDVKIQAERRDDLEHDYHRDLENRRLRQDRGDLLNLHDDDFTFLYERERDIYDTELQLAIDSADELRKICTEAGLEISVGKLDQSDVGEHDASSSSTLDLPKVISPDRAPSPFSLAFSRLMRGGTKSSMEGISVFEMDLMSNMELDASNEDESLTHIARWVEDTQEGIPASSSADATYYSSFAARSGPYTVPALSRRQSPNRSSRPSLKPKSESDVLNTMTQPIGAIADLPEHAHRDVTN